MIVQPFFRYGAAGFRGSGGVAQEGSDEDAGAAAVFGVAGLVLQLAPLHHGDADE